MSENNIDKFYIQPSVLYLAIANNKINGVITKWDKEKARFEYDFKKTSRGEALLSFCYCLGRYAPFKIAGKNNKKLHQQMLSFFGLDKEMFNRFFLPPKETLNICYPETFEGFTQCEFIRDKLTKKDDLYYLDTKLKFGKYKGKAIREILSFDQNYIKYLIQSGKNFSNSVLNIFN